MRQLHFWLEAGDELAQVGRAMVPSRFTVHLVDYANLEPDVDLKFEVRNGSHECREIRVKSADDHAREVRATDLAEIRIDDALEMAIQVIFYGGSTGDKDNEIARGVQAAREARAARAARRVKITDPLLREVARVYRDNVGNKPTDAVAKHFGRAHRTAVLYIATARERGFLGPAIKGKAGER